MRILWLSHLIPYPPKAGVLQRCFYLIQELAKFHDIELMAFVQPDLLMSFYSSYEEGIEETRGILKSIVKDVDYFDITSEQHRFGKKLLALKGLFSPNGYTLEWLQSDIFAHALKQKLSDNTYELVHFDTISLAIYKDHIHGIPAVLDHHNIESHMMLRRSEKESNLFKKLYFYQEGIKLTSQEKKWCKQFELNVTCSDMDTIRLREITGDVPCASVPNGVDTEYFKPLGGQKRKKSLIFIGTMNWYPNIEAVEFIINQIWPSLRKHHPDITLDIVGASPPQHILKYNGNDGINIHGFVDDIRTLFDSAHIYICPIMDGGGTKLKILDALAMGKAIVAHPVACEGINVENGESVVFCESANDFVMAIDDLLMNESQIEFLGKNARDLAVREYTFKNIGKKLSDLFIDVRDKFYLENKRNDN